MSWSEDTRCLYCEGRLPLYRKITHGQFCSSAHRKSYWQEHERLAVERLHQTHSSLRAFQQGSQQELEPYPEHPPAALVSVAYPEMDLELDPVPSLGGSLYPVPDLDSPDDAPLAASDLLGLLSPEVQVSGDAAAQLVAADPFEYEITRQPLPPEQLSSGPETGLLPEASPMAVWSYLPPAAPASLAEVTQTASNNGDSAVAPCHPKSSQPAVGMSAAGLLELPSAEVLESPRRSASSSTLRVLQMEPAAITSVVLEVPLQSDVLLQLLDEHVPHPDQMYELAQFGAHSLPASQTVHAPQAIQREAVNSAVTSSISSSGNWDCEPSIADMLRLLVEVQPTQGNLFGRSTISELAAAIRPPQISSPATLAIEPAEHFGTCGLESLSPNRPQQGLLLRKATDLAALDLSTGVSSDVTFPDLAPGARIVVEPGVTGILPLTFTRKRKAEASRPQPIARLLPQTLETHPAFPSSGLQPLDRKPASDFVSPSGALLDSWMGGNGLKKLEPAWAHATGFWHHAPRDLKLLLFAIPALLALVFHPGWPRVAFAAPQRSGSFTSGLTRALGNQWVNVRQTLESRAAVALDEDFRSGLDNWASPGGSTTEWSFDPTGFVRPGPLAIYRPSVGLADYQVQFLGMIDKKAMSWVVRASDFENFYVVKLEMLKSGPMPAIGLTRYAVINGKALDRHDVAVPLSVRTDTLYRVRMDVQGSEFSVEIQGQMADNWTETRLARGGIGFFTASGEASRLRWVQITHQYDMLGRLCAYLAPYDTTNGSWQP